MSNRTTSPGNGTDGNPNAAGNWKATLKKELKFDNKLSNLMSGIGETAVASMDNGVISGNTYNYGQTGLGLVGSLTDDPTTKAYAAMAQTAFAGANRLGGQEGDYFHVNQNVAERMVGGYQGTYQQLNQTQDENGFFGLFGNGKRKAHNEDVIKDQIIQENLKNIDIENQNRQAMSANVQQNTNRYNQKLNGIDYRYLRAAKSGIKLENLNRIINIKKSSVKFKQGGSVKPLNITNPLDIDNTFIPTLYYTDCVIVFEDGGKVKKQFPKEYVNFINSIKEFAPNFAELNPKGYNMYRYWELNGKPKNWQEALQKEMFHKQSDGYHAHSIAWNENGEGEWMKHKSFPTAWMEKAFYDGYEFITDVNGNPLFLDTQPEYEGVRPVLRPLTGEQAEESKRLRENYDLVEDENGNRKYVPKKHKEGGSIKEPEELVKLEEFVNFKPKQLSGGQKQRVAIAGVISMEPEILILDEPTSGLDPMGREHILSLIKKYREQTGKTVIIVSHSMDDVARYATKVIVMAFNFFASAFSFNCFSVKAAASFSLRSFFLLDALI